MEYWSDAKPTKSNTPSLRLERLGFSKNGITQNLTRSGVLNFLKCIRNPAHKSSSGSGIIIGDSLVIRVPSFNSQFGRSELVLGLHHKHTGISRKIVRNSFCIIGIAIILIENVKDRGADFQGFIKVSPNEAKVHKRIGG